MYYDKQIRYIDYLENGEKQRNCGYVKMTVTGKRLLLEMQIKGLYETDDVASEVVLEGAGAERSIGVVQIRQGSGSLWWEIKDAENEGEALILGNGMCYGQLERVQVQLSSRRSLCCVWRETVPRMMGLRQTEEAAGQAGVTAKRSYSLGETPGSGKQSPGESGTGQNTTPSGELAFEGSGREGGAQTVTSAPGVLVAAESGTGSLTRHMGEPREAGPRELEGIKANGDVAADFVKTNVQRPVEDKRPHETRQKNGTGYNSEISSKSDTANKSDTGSKSEIDNGGEMETEREARSKSGPGSESGIRGRRENESERASDNKSGRGDKSEAASKSGIESKSGAEDRRKNESQSGSGGKKEAENVLALEGAGLRRADASAASAKRADEIGAGQESNRKSLAPQLDTISEDKWQQLWKIYPHTRPFQDEREYLSLRPEDFVILHSNSYRLAQNSFLLHGYFNYEHLILTQVPQRNGKQYYIGVPGNFYEKEKQVAIMYGFGSFECKREPAGEGDFGYYMIKVEL